MPETVLKETSTKEEPEGEILDFNNPDFKFIPQGRHLWRQQGFYLVCYSCELQHAVWIGQEKVMVGENLKGEPILKNRKDVGL